MARFRKKPVVVHAWPVFDVILAILTGERLPSLLVKSVPSHLTIKRGDTWAEWRLCILTDTGAVVQAPPGDWLILGTKGELYPCTDEVFGEIYEHVRMEGVAE